MKRLSFLILAPALFSLTIASVIPAADAPSTAYTGSKEFEQMKQLVGTWEGTSKEGRKVRVVYRMTAGGSAIVETLFPGGPEEMVSVYHDRKGRLVMTHYCLLQNQPRMKLAKADEKTLDFELADDSGIDAATETHMHGVTIMFVEKDKIVHKWTLLEKGKEKGVTEFTLSRVR